jgi:hypothetical protein
LRQAKECLFRATEFCSNHSRNSLHAWVVDTAVCAYGPAMRGAVQIRPILGGSARVVGKTLLFSILTTLVVLEPLVSFICCFMMFGGIFAAIVFEVSAVGPRFPFLVIFGMSLAFGVLLLLYQVLIALLLKE